MPFFGVPIRNGLPIGLGSVAGFGVQQFDPSLLFEGGTVPGAWYDPSDLSTMFDTSAGTTPVAMPGQGAAVPVGLMLDKSQGLVLGPELVTNGDFSNGTTGWQAFNANTSISNDSNTLKQTVAAGSSAAARPTAGFTTVIGRTYQLTYQVVEVSAGASNVKAYVGTASGGSAGGVEGPSRNTPGNVSAVFVATAATYFLTTEHVGAVGTFTRLDNISVRELPGNHAIAINNTTARPELRARVNLLTYSEEFQNAAWTKSNATITANAAVAPNGTTTAENYSGNSGTSSYFNQSISVLAGVGYSFIIYAKANTTNILQIAGGGTGFASSYANFDLSDGSIGAVSGSVATIASAGNGWWRCQVTQTAVNNDSNNFFVALVPSKTSARIAALTSNSSVFVWGADLRPANIGANVPAYQRIADADTYDTNGFPLYLRFDGIDDGMYTPASIPFATVTSDGQARRNLLNNPTQFDVNTVWTATNATVTANNATAPDGTLTADTLTSSGIAAAQRVGQNTTQTGQVTFSVYAKAGTAQFLQILNSADGNCFANFDLATPQTGTKGTGATSTITVDTSGWCRCTITFTLGSAAQWYVYLAPSASATYGQSFTATVAALSVWGAQLELGSTATAFQNIGTDKVAVFAGVRKLSGAAASLVAETSSSSINAGAFGLFDPAGGTSPDRTYSFRSESAIAISSPEVLAPTTYVSASQANRAAPSIVIRRNGVQVGSTTASQGAGNYSTYPLYIGARNNASAWLNGHLHSLIIAGSAVSAGNISATEQWVAGKTGIQI